MNNFHTGAARLMGDGDTAAHNQRYAPHPPRAAWLAVATAEGNSRIEYDWTAHQPAAPGELGEGSLLLSGDMSAYWNKNLKRNPRERFKVELTENGSKISS